MAARPGIIVRGTGLTRAWECSCCTYHHEGARAQLVFCEMCGAPKMEDAKAQQAEAVDEMATTAWRTAIQSDASDSDGDSNGDSDDDSDDDSDRGGDLNGVIVLDSEESDVEGVGDEEEVGGMRETTPAPVVIDLTDSPEQSEDEQVHTTPSTTQRPVSTTPKAHTARRNITTARTPSAAKRDLLTLAQVRIQKNASRMHRRSI